MKIARALAVIVCCLFIFNENGLAQARYTFTNYTQENGLASSTLTGIVKDSTGFLWLASENGLTRFDGYDFKIFRSNTADSSGLSSPYILGIYIDNQKNILVRTLNSLDRFNSTTASFKKIISFTGATYFQSMVNGSTGAWLAVKGNLVKINAASNNYSLFPYPAPSSQGNFINSIEYNNCIFISDNKNILKFDIAEKQFSYVSISSGDSVSDKTPGNILRFFKNKQGKPGFYSQAGLYCFDETTSRFRYINKCFIDKEKYLHAVSGNCVGDNGILYIVTRSGELHCINTTTGADSVIDLKLKCTETPVKDLAVLGAHYTYGQNVWFNTLSSGIFKLDIGTNAVEQYSRGSAVNNIPSDGCNYIFDDNNGILWLSLPGTGLAKGEEIKQVFKTYSPLPETDLQFSSHKNNIRKICDFDNEHLLILTLDGVFLFNKKTGIFSYLENPVTQKPLLPDRAFSDATFDKDSTLWIGSWYGTGLHAVNFDKKKVINIIPSIENGMKPPASVRSLYLDSRQNLWIGTANNCIYRLHLNSNLLDNPASAQIDVFNSTRLKNDSLVFNIVFSIAAVNPDEIVFGTQNGLYIYSYKTNRFQKHGSASKRTYPASEDIRAVYADRQNTLWLGTNGGGLNRLYMASNIVEVYSTQHGLPDNVIYSITEDNAGYLWLGTNKGLCRFDKNKISCRNYSPKDGIQNFEFNTNAVCKTTNGSLAFGGVNGFNLFNPAAVTNVSLLPEIIITEFKAGDMELNAGSKEVYLNHNQNYLSFQFAALNYFRNSENKFAYCLSGLDKDWIYCDNRRFTSYANLPPGTYTFRVKASNYYGEWNQSAAGLTIHIATPWYNSWLFRGLLLIFISGLVYIVFRIRLQQKLKLQDVRNKIARDLHDEIGSNLSSIALFSAVAKESAGNEKTGIAPLLKKISDYTQVSQEAMNDIVWMINSHNDSFENTIVRMRSLAAELFEAKNVLLHLDFEERLNHLKIGMDERKNFYLIYKEAVTNIVKYSECENFWVQLFLKNSQVVLLIKDDGKGFDASKKYTGNGLNNMQNRAAELRGNLQIKSEPGQGTSVQLQFEIT